MLLDYFVLLSSFNNLAKICTEMNMNIGNVDNQDKAMCMS